MKNFILTVIVLSVWVLAFATSRSHIEETYARVIQPTPSILR